MAEVALWTGVIANVINAIALLAIGFYIAPKFNLSTLPMGVGRVLRFSGSALFIGSGITTMARAWYMIAPPSLIVENWAENGEAIAVFVLQAIASVTFFVVANRYLNIKIFDRRAHERILEEYLMEVEALNPPVNRVDPDNPEHAQWLAMFDEAINGDIMRPFFQRIVNTNTLEAAGYEALTRFEGYPEVSPEEWFVAAERFGVQRKFEIAAVKQVLENMDQLPLGHYVTINVSQETFLSMDLIEMITSFGPITHRYVLELTEHVATVRYKPLQDASEVIRHLGIKIAVDDVGSGFASMRRVIELRPEIIKVDRSLSRDIVTSEHQQALVRSLVAYARDVNVVLVVEGVETEEQLRVLRRLGVRFGQGYYFGRPEPIART